MRTIKILTLSLSLLIPGSVQSFVIHPSSLSTSKCTTSSIALQAFWDKKKSEPETKSNKKTGKKPSKINKKKVDPPVEKKKNPMVALFGKPQINWVTMEPMKGNSDPKRMNWLVKPNDK
eukprot:CAMPEP_0194270322 /NCGR_PEP_ID=MMETSP0169-20130528/4330_1 /TAXON_ID=218684 /ORGANISM="Corethron pennatum, Strain L29A3" /LENGTH=118 /DNA_ID=CAMNT_0039012329 /DNA_START=89 /DNA_END=445 /DNA_ORIENTATION=-